MPLKYCPTIQVLAVSSTTTYPSEIEHHQNGDCLILGTPIAESDDHSLFK